MEVILPNGFEEITEVASCFGQDKSGERNQVKPSTQGSKATGERYLPEKAIKALSDSEYKATTAAKRRAVRRNKQVSKQPKKIASKTKSYRSYS